MRTPGLQLGGTRFRLALLILAAALVMGAVGGFNSPAIYFAVAGNPLVINPPVQTVVIKDPSKPEKVAFTLKNTCLADIEVLGVESGCGCVAVEDIPLVVPAKSERQLSFEVHGAADQVETVARAVRLYINRPSAGLSLTVWIQPNYADRSE